MIQGRGLRLRSFLFLPAHNRRFIDKALSSDADAIILDIEDGVPQSRRPEARANVVEFGARGELSRKTVFVRLNPMDSDDFVRDVCELTIPGVDGFMPSKVETPEDVEFLDRLLGFFERRGGLPVGGFALAPLIETTGALERVGAIARASARLVALCFGGEDYLNDLGSVFTYQESAFVHPRAMVANAARANGLLPIDTPYLDVRDEAGFRRCASLSYRNGFAGCLLINPCQIALANESYSPDAGKVALSRRVAAAVREASASGASGVAMVDGSMVGPPMRKRAEAVLRQIGECDAE